MGMPQINVEFKAKSVSAIQRSALGIVALILRDTTNLATQSTVTIRSIEDLKQSDWNETNYDYIQKTLLGTPSKIIVIKIAPGTEEEPVPITEALTKLNLIKFNYLAMPGATAAEAEQIALWSKAKRLNEKKTVKAVLANQKADDMGVINFTTTGIKVGAKAYTTQEYTARIAGILAGLPFSRSATFYELPEVTDIENHADPDEAIEDGELILVNDGEKIKIGRGVNSLTTVTSEQKADYKKIKIVEVMDMIRDDIRDVFANHYVGKVSNITDNQYLFIGSIIAYFKGLAAESILDPNYENTADIDVNSQRLAHEEIGTDTTSWNDAKVRNMPFGSYVFLAGNVKIVDAMEDLDFNIFSA